MSRNRKYLHAIVPALVLVLFLQLTASAFAQEAERMSKLQREIAQSALKETADTIRKNYYDPNFHGVDFEALVKVAEQKLASANTLTEAMAVIGWMTNGLNDSHTFFVPPRKPYEVEHGWKMQFYGDHCYITAVKEGSEASAIGLKPGDEVTGWERFHFNREDLWKMEALFLYFSPRSGTTLLVAAPGAQPKELLVNAKVRPLQKKLKIDASNFWNLVRDSENWEKFRNPRWVEVGETLVVRMPSFELTDSTMGQLLSAIHHHKSVVLDLRGNAGGYEERLKELVSGTFDHEVKIGDIVERKAGNKAVTAKPRSPFTGKLVVLIDSRSASASELYARVVQSEKRGVVLGDRSSGSVMRSRFFYGDSEPSWGYGVSVTVADLVMTDGKHLEHAGVTPDEIILPTQADLAAGRDPMLSKAIGKTGTDITPEAAGKLFPVIWNPPTLLN